MSDLENFDIRPHIFDSIIETFDTMISMEIEPSDSEPPDTSGTNRIVAAVNFAGKVAGIFNFQVTSEFARLMNANMLGIEPEEVEGDDEIKDLLAEVSNIVGGNLKSALNDAGLTCVLSTPSITYGADFTIKSLNMERFERFVFKYQQNFIIVEVGLKTQQSSGDEDSIGAADTLGQLSEVDIEKINALDINTKVSEAVVDVFDTMLSLKLEVADSITSESLEGVRNVGSVSFAGDVTGMVSIHIGDDFSREMAAEMLGMEVEEIEGDEEIRDMLGELGNIVGGNLKSAYTDAGLACALSTPSVTTGTDFTIEALNMEQYQRLAFRCNENIVFAEIGIKISELVQAAGQQGKDIHYSVDDNAKQDATVAMEEKEPKEEPTKTASISDIAEQPDNPVKSSDSKVEKQRQQKKSTPPAAVEEKERPTLQQPKTSEDVDLDLLLDIPLEIKVELGRARMPINKLLNLAPGSAVKFQKLEGDPVDIFANDTLIARGEVVVQKEKYGIRVIEITSRMDRIRSFSI